MKTNIKTRDPKESLRKAKICEDIFDSITIYIHMTYQDFCENSNVPREPLCRLSFSNIPFTDKKWKENLHHIDMNELPEDSEENTTALSHNIHKKLMLDLAYILTIRGHEIFICLALDPLKSHGTVCEYTCFSSSIKNSLRSFKDT